MADERPLIPAELAPPPTASNWLVRFCANSIGQRTSLADIPPADRPARAQADRAGRMALAIGRQLGRGQPRWPRRCHQEQPITRCRLCSAAHQRQQFQWPGRRRRRRVLRKVVGRLTSISVAVPATPATVARMDAGAEQSHFTEEFPPASQHRQGCGGAGAAKQLACDRYLAVVRQASGSVADLPDAPACPPGWRGAGPRRSRSGSSVKQLDAARRTIFSCDYHLPHGHQHPVRSAGKLSAQAAFQGAITALASGLGRSPRSRAASLQAQTLKQLSGSCSIRFEHLALGCLTHMLEPGRLLLAQDGLDCHWCWPNRLCRLPSLL